MATNQTQQIRTIYTTLSNIAGLTQAEILQLIRSDTAGGFLADVDNLQMGDIVTIAPNNVAAGLIDNPHDAVTAAQGEVAARTFYVLEIGTDDPALRPQRRHVLAELATTPTLFW